MFRHQSRCVLSSVRRGQAIGVRQGHASPKPEKRLRSKRTGKKHYTVVAIETSCDDTSVAVVGVRNAGWKELISTGFLQSERVEHKRFGLDVYCHERITANNDAYTGIHPLVALESHRANLAPLLRRAFDAHKERLAGAKDADEFCRRPGNDLYDSTFPAPEFVAVTRGPGMRSNLSVGLDTAKGLAAAWGVPLIGVHHMQAHALTPRLITAKANWHPWTPENPDPYFGNVVRDSDELEPAFPFLSVLVSGGHTMLIDSTGLTEHTTLAETQDIAIGDLLDKAARAILPPQMLKPPFGRALEQFAFESEVRRVGQDGLDNLEIDRNTSQDDTSDEFIQPHECKYDYTPPTRRQDELESRPTGWGWSLTPPLAESKGGEKSSRRMVYSFAGLLTYVERLMKRNEHISLLERQVMAREVQRVAFEHLASRILLHISSTQDWKGDTIVVSGGVASNNFLRHLLRTILDIRGFSHIKLSFPPIELCTDNALMIAWAGVEMYEAGYTSSLDIGPIRKWSMDPKAPDGGILGVNGWMVDEDFNDDED